MPLPPGPRIGSIACTARFMWRPIDSLLTWHRRYGDAFTVPYLRFGTGVYVADPDEIRSMFTGDQSSLLAGEANSPLEPVLGSSSVLVLDGPEHIRQRKLLSPPLQGDRLGSIRETIREVASTEIDGWRSGETIVVRARMRQVTFDVIARTVFGVSDPDRIARLREALMALLNLGPAFFLPDAMRTNLGRYSPGGIFEARLAAADHLLYEEIALRRAAPDLDRRGDVLSALLRARDDDGGAMSDAELRDELITMLAAGHETTATGLAFAFELVARHPEVQERLRSEPDDDAYLKAVVSEVLRLRPVIDASERTLTEPRQVCGYQLPAGIRVYPAAVCVHHRADIYPEPERFRPERFLEGEQQPYSWIPFGGGIRRCIGASLAQAEIAEILRIAVTRRRFEPVRRDPDPVVLSGITLAPSRGVALRITG